MPKIKKKRDDVLSPEEVAQMIDKAPSPMFQCLIAMLFNFGMRITEALQLRHKDIWIDNGYLFIKPITLKTRSKSVITERRILKRKLNSPFLYYIVEYVKGGDQERFIYESSYTGRPYSRQHILMVITRLNSTVWCHLFRHTRATIFGEEGATETQLMAWFGWTDTRPASRYIRKSEALIQKLADGER